MQERISIEEAIREAGLKKKYVAMVLRQEKGLIK